MRAPTKRRSPVNGWGAYVQRQLDVRGWSNTDLATAGDFDRSLIGRWINEDKQATIESIRAVCKAFGRDIREGLIAAGLFTPAELRVSLPGPPDVGLLSDAELIMEVARRMNRRTGDQEQDSLGNFAEHFSQDRVQDGELVRTAHQEQQGGIESIEDEDELHPRRVAISGD